MSATTMSEAAKRLAAQGFRVHPLKVNAKQAILDDWPNRAASDVGFVESNWQKAPYNIGIATGNGLLVLDFDMKPGQKGADSLKLLEMTGLPDTLRARTPSGGVHVYLKTPPDLALGNSASKLLPHVDVRAHHGYVAAPGSVIDGKRYEWVDPAQTIADAPDWLLRDIERARPRKENRHDPVGEIDTHAAIDRAIWYLEHEAPESVEKAAGDNTAFRVAARVKDFGVGIEKTYELMADHWNEKKAFPPWGPEELLEKVENAFAHGREPPGVASAAAQFEPVEIGDYRTAQNGTEARGKLYALDFDEAADQALVQVTEPLIEGVLDQGTMSVLYGASNSGKTFVALDMAYSVATGRSWNGKEAMGGLVVYIAAEGGPGIRKRLRALRQERRHDGRVHLVVIPCPVDLLRGKGDISQLLEIVTDAEARHGVGAAMVVVDTASRALSGGDENSSVDMGTLVKNLDLIRQRTRAHLMVVHHSGKDRAKGARGHSSLRAATDTELEIIDKTISVTKQRDLDPIDDMPFALDKVVVGQDVKGREVSTCVVRILNAFEAADRADEEEAERKRHQSPVKQAETLETLKTLGVAEGERWFSVAEIAKAMPSEAEGDFDDAKRRRVSRALDKLVKLGFAEHQSGTPLYRQAL